MKKRHLLPICIELYGMITLISTTSARLSRMESRIEEETPATDLH